MEKFEKLQGLIESMNEDVTKAAGGNKAAGIRARKVLQEVKKVAQDLRVDINEATKK